MNCEEFRKLMSTSTGDEAALAKHLDSCSECDVWLKSELDSPPPGLTQAQWHDATARCFPEKLPTAADQKAEPDFWHYFFNGLKYGMVFGLSLVTGFALLDSFEKPVEPGSQIELVSFIDDEYDRADSTATNLYSDVTFLDADESKSVSFLPNVQMQSFYNTDQEETTWNENSG